MSRITVNGVKLPEFKNANYYREDGLVLSFCNVLSEDIAKRLGKEACVKIFNIYKLKDLIDKQLECDSKIGDCDYTNDHRRNHFLKSSSDRWQEEFRIFWQIKEPRNVIIPSRIAELVAVYKK